MFTDKTKSKSDKAAEHYMRARLWLLSGMAKRKVYEALEKAVFMDDRYRKIIRGDILFRSLSNDPVLKRILGD
ncbi:MAG: hypothetical protein J7M18_00715 [Candidatus Eremiobacteraeota bacterium]|nr:hypothetical protein [Candidatus Eremiobacteraeota bacterium]